MNTNQHPYEEAFLILLLLIAMAGLIWFFYPFLPALLFAMLVATATYPLYKKLRVSSRLNANQSALVLSFGILCVVILPVTYLFIEGAKMGSDVMHQVNHWLSQQPVGTLMRLESETLALLPITDAFQKTLLTALEEQTPVLIEKTKMAGVWLASNLFSGLTSFLTFMAISLFSLFFFYRDGEGISNKIKHLSPLTNHLDQFIMHRFSNLASTLTISVLGIALLQGMTFGVLMMILDMPWLFLGLAYAVASFVPIIGGFLVWGPIAVYFLLFDQAGYAILVALYSSLIIGIGIDNVLRPMIIGKVSSFRGDPNGQKSVLDHTWFTMISTFAGLLHFGIMGLIFGPMLAAMAITIFDVYEHKHRHQLDYS